MKNSVIITTEFHGYTGERTVWYHTGGGNWDTSKSVAQRYTKVEAVDLVDTMRYEGVKNLQVGSAVRMR